MYVYLQFNYHTWISIALSIFRYLRAPEAFLSELVAWIKLKDIKTTIHVHTNPSKTLPGIIVRCQSPLVSIILIQANIADPEKCLSFGKCS